MTSIDESRLGMLDGLPHPVWVVSRGGLIDHANPASASALGYGRADELRGQPSHDMMHSRRADGSLYPESECPMLGPRISGMPGHGEDEWLVRRDGSMFLAAWWSSPIDLADGVGAVLCFADISQRRATERDARDRVGADTRLEETRASRRRIIESQSTGGQQIAHALHDGPQQRLVSVLIALRLIREELASPPGAVGELLDQASAETKGALAELREVVAEIHPGILSSRGLAAAVKALADRAPLPVNVFDLIDRRVDTATQVHAYHVVAEALGNAVTHSRASLITVRMISSPEALIVEISDDGVGGADITAEKRGLVGIADRVDAVDGTFTVTSPPAGGTVLSAAFPL